MKSSYLFAKILITGGIVLGLELVASRIMTPFFGVSLYVWSSILSVTLIALALGYKFGGVLSARMGRGDQMLAFASAGALAALWLDACLWTYPFIFLPLADFNLVAGSIIACVYLLFVPLVILSALNPLLVALLTGEQDKGDHGAGSVFFISTVGSVLGVFVVTYGLLQYVTNYQAVVILALASAALSLVLLMKIRDFANPAFRRFFGLSVAGFLIAGGTLASGGLERMTGHIVHNNVTWRIVHAEPSYFGYLQVAELSDSKGVPVMLALLNDGMLQNRFYEPGVSSSPYTYALESLAYAAAVPSPKRALVLGIGGGILPMAFDQGGLEVHAVDINDKIVSMAKAYLGFDPGAVKIDIEDARTAARHCQPGYYDIVAVDLFRDDGIPEHLVTREFFSDIRNCMNDQGVMVMNSFMTAKAPASEYALLQTIAGVFGGVYFLPGDNAYIVARRGDPITSLNVPLNSLPEEIGKQLAAALKNARAFTPGDPVLQGAPVLSDISNQWKHLAHATETEYRRSVVENLPWQVLLN